MDTKTTPKNNPHNPASPANPQKGGGTSSPVKKKSDAPGMGKTDIKNCR